MSRDFIANDLRTWKVGDEIVLTAGLIHKEQSDVPRYVRYGYDDETREWIFTGEPRYNNIVIKIVSIFSDIDTYTDKYGNEYETMNVDALVVAGRTYFSPLGKFGLADPSKFHKYYRRSNCCH